MFLSLSKVMLGQVKVNKCTARLKIILGLESPAGIRRKQGWQHPKVAKRLKKKQKAKEWKMIKKIKNLYQIFLIVYLSIIYIIFYFYILGKQPLFKNYFVLYYMKVS